jgi:hypothetical protein
LEQSKIRKDSHRSHAAIVCQGLPPGERGQDGVHFWDGTPYLEVDVGSVVASFERAGVMDPNVVMVKVMTGIRTMGGWGRHLSYSVVGEGYRYPEVDGAVPCRASRAGVMDPNVVMVKVMTGGIRTMGGRG